MSRVVSKVTTKAILELDEEQLRALDALVGYGFKPFVEVFYEKMGKHYLQPHEQGLKRLFETIRRDVPNALAKVDMARKFLEDKGR